MPSYPLTKEEFEQEQAAGQYSSTCTYDDYLAVIRDRPRRLRELQEKARRDGFELTAAQPPYLSEEDDELLTRIWERYAAEQKATEERLAA
jgi:hypothetical protein